MSSIGFLLGLRVMPASRRPSVEDRRSRLHIRPLLPFRAESVVLMTARNTRAIGLQPCESMVCKFPITQSESVDPGGRTRSLLQMPSRDRLLAKICAVLHHQNDTFCSICTVRPSPGSPNWGTAAIAIFGG